MAWPTTNDPRTEFVTLRLTKSEAAQLDVFASRRKLNRSAAVRAAVATMVQLDQRRAAQKNRNQGASS